MSAPAAGRRRWDEDQPHGVLLIDKPRGPTSHDIVARARKGLRSRAIGHAGTLDPMASGLLVLAVGEATKLVPYLIARDKTYQATITLGSETDTLDAEGRVVKERPVPAHLCRATVEQAARSFRGAITQRAPAVSAIKRDGVALYKRARRGEQVQGPLRKVTVNELRIVEVREREIDIHINCTKGFYLRALARDLAAALQTVGHLTALRRIRSGDFDLSRASDAAMLQRAASLAQARLELRRRLIAPAEACGPMPRLSLTEAGCQDAFHGRPVRPSGLVSGTLPDCEPGPIALLDGGHRLVAIARLIRGELQVERGFRYGSS